MLKISVVIPTKNAGKAFAETLEALKNQIFEGKIELIVIDSGSTDDTLTLANQYGASVYIIPPQEFNHGLTRNHAIEKTSGEIIILMSQDAIPGDRYLIKNFVNVFNDPQVAGVYARQIPKEDADIITKRNLNNWLTGRTTDEIKWIKDWQAYKTLSPIEHYQFCNFDNVCSAIRKNVWQSIPFTANDFGEDIDWAQRVLEAGWKIVYCSSSFVIHSHQRSFKYEYNRNYLGHKKLYQQFKIVAVPSIKQILISTWISTWLDWRYIIQNEKSKMLLIRMIITTPFLNFASVYGQYIGLKLGQRKK